jgi:hypothetical protein
MMKNLFDIFREKLAAKEFGNKEKHWKELEKRLNANDASKGGGWFPAGLVFSILVGLGAFVLLFPVFMNDDSKTFFNPLNSNTDLVIAQNESKMEEQSVSKSEKAIDPEVSTLSASTSNTNLGSFENPIPPAQATVTEKYFTNKNASFIRIPAPDFSANQDRATENKRVEANANFSNATPISDPAMAASTPIASTSPESLSFTTNGMAPSNHPLMASSAKNQISLGSVSSLPLFMLDAGTANLSLLPFKKEVPDYFAKSSFGFKVGLYAGLQYTQSMVNESVLSNASLVERIKKEESGMLTAVAGFDFQVSKKGWSISSGLNYYQQGEHRNYSDDFLQTKCIDSVFYTPVNKTIVGFDTTLITIVHQQNGWVVTDTLVTYYNEASGTFVTANLPMVVMVNNGTDTTYQLVIDSVFTQIIDSLRNGLWTTRDFRGSNEGYASLLKGKNTYTYFEIPLMLGYDWRIKNFSIGLKAGIGFGILTQQTAYYLSTDERRIEPYLIEQSNKLVYNVIVRPDFNYWLGKNWGISCSPFMRMNLNNLKQNPTERNSYRNIGVQAGINYRW